MYTFDTFKDSPCIFDTFKDSPCILAPGARCVYGGRRVYTEDDVDENVRKSTKINETRRKTYKSVFLLVATREKCVYF